MSECWISLEFILEYQLAKMKLEYSERHLTRSTNHRNFLPVLLEKSAPKRSRNSVDKKRHAFWTIFAHFCPFFALQFFGNFVDKFIKIQIQCISIQFQTWLLVDRNGERNFRRDCCPGSSPSEPPCPAKERKGDGSPLLSLESLLSSRHDGNCKALRCKGITHSTKCRELVPLA